jgi:hypothetical protein
VQLLLIALEVLHCALGELVGERVGGDAVRLGDLCERLALLHLGAQIVNRHVQDRRGVLQQRATGPAETTWPPVAARSTGAAVAGAAGLTLWPGGLELLPGRLEGVLHSGDWQIQVRRERRCKLGTELAAGPSLLTVRRRWRRGGLLGAGNSNREREERKHDQANSREAQCAW